MVDVVTSDEMRKIEEASGIPQEQLMEQAGKQVAAVVCQFVKEKGLAQKAYILAGKGNNGGDGYVVARLLLQEGFSVQVLQVLPIDPTSLVKKQRRRFEARGGKVIDFGETMPAMPTEGVIIDAIFGTGFHGIAQEPVQKVIEAVSRLHLPVIAIDVPSGLDASTGIAEGACLSATVTVAIEFPKIGYFLNQGFNLVGTLSCVPIGLTSSQRSNFQLLEEQEVRSFLPKIERTRHKYTAGHVVGLAGSHGMAGASLLASFAALRSGAGIVHLLHPEKYSQEFAYKPLEVVSVPYEQQDLGILRHWLSRATSCFIGPGLGNQAALLEVLWSDIKEKKMVIDADALQWLSSLSTPYLLPNAVLTPHIGEMHRLLKLTAKEPLSLDFLQKCKDFATAHTTNLLVKGAPTFLFAEQQPVKILARGDPGMATAGSGDVLTGIIASLLAQGLTAQQAMSLGAFLHAVAGEEAAKEETSYCMIASSITEKLPEAFKSLS